MTDKIRVLIQMQHSPAMNMAAASSSAPPDLPAVSSIAGCSLDRDYAPVQLPRKERRSSINPQEVGRLFTFDSRPEVSTYLVRAEVENEQALDQLMAATAADPNVVGCFSDPKISTVRAVCPTGAVGNHQDVENQLLGAELRNRGMDGSNVLVAIVDTGVNMAHLNDKGKTPSFDSNRSWSPVPGSVLGSMPVDHGTMCAFDVCIAAPNCTLLDYALLQSQATGGSVMDGFLSDAVRGFSKLLSIMTGANPPRALVVNNSWGMFHPSWDFPVGHPGNYSDNPDHPFNIIVESLEDAGADILFAAGNCGQECPDRRCEGATSEGIYGANSHSSVLSVAGVSVNKNRLGYSTQGPGRLDSNKPDLCAYTHFIGSEVYSPSPDGGTSAACPVAAGVVAAIRSVYSPTDLSPAQLRNLLHRSAEDIGLQGFDYDYGYGLINVPGLLSLFDLRETIPIAIGQTVSGSLSQSEETLTYKLDVGKGLTLALDGPNGADFDIYVRKDREPTVDDYDYRGYTGSADEKIRIEPVMEGEYYIMVRSYRGAGDFTLTASLD